MKQIKNESESSHNEEEHDDNNEINQTPTDLRVHPPVVVMGKDVVATICNGLLKVCYYYFI